jgi:hypothetical protein
MPIPTYKRIQIKSASQDVIYEQLATQSFETQPHILEIQHLPNQDKVISHIEEFLKLRKIFHYPYPQYIISHEINHDTHLVIIKSDKEIPKYFDRRVKSPNIKEAEILNLCTLKQKRLQNIRFDDISGSIRDFARSQKKLYSLSTEGLFLEAIHQKLNEDDQEDE